MAVAQIMNNELLETSLTLGAKFLVTNQLEAGNFRYQYNFVTKQYDNDDNQVRQAGALWGLALIYRHRPSLQLQRAFLRGVDFFLKHAREKSGSAMYLTYPGERNGRSGAVALFSLALIEYLGARPAVNHRQELLEILVKTLAFLMSLRTEEGRFSASYSYEDGVGFGAPSPYFDGEILLALGKALLELKAPVPAKVLAESAEAMYRVYVVDALAKEPDSDLTKGFYQWGSMAYFQLINAGVLDSHTFGRRILDLACWMIDEHRTLSRRRNTGYAYEGLVTAYQTALRMKNEDLTNKIKRVIDEGLMKLTSWQVGSPVQNDYLRTHFDGDVLALGGVMNHRAEPDLRIDVCQHQMHAVILAQTYVYTDT